MATCQGKFALQGVETAESSIADRFAELRHGRRVRLRTVAPGDVDLLRRMELRE